VVRRLSQFAARDAAFHPAPRDSAFGAIFFEATFGSLFVTRSDDLLTILLSMPIDERFMEKVVNELNPNGSGDIAARFVKSTSEMRRANNQLLPDLRFTTEARFPWSQPFFEEPNTRVEAYFADVRNFLYQGIKIDQQVHLGHDLSGNQHAEGIAANDGKVVYLAPLGSTANFIVVDHGYGLQSIYGHLGDIAVHEGDLGEARTKHGRGHRQDGRRARSFQHAAGGDPDRPQTVGLPTG
jgi:murein DD-endopeptidase MepM/ murein hydrolase activator NlpD